ncbi:unnamed protein product [Paramecium pentaurelia]|uniref:Uncharacterized protein n=1 Tax=Paramecium pentaurelia TaxID=43138 RepID=A0A8S1VN56_9CILI|nr:unnamed protein product [Paramecium pentaurelia]
MKCYNAESELQTTINSKQYPSEVNSPQTETQPIQKERRKWNSDEMTKYCPIDIPNAFQYDKVNGQKFQLFLDGKYSANKLVKDMNVVIKRKRLTQLEQEFHKQKEQQQLRKELVERRFTKVRTLINSNIKLRESLKLESNLKGSRMFSQLNNHIVDHIAKIKSKDLLTDRIDGVRQYEPTKLYDYSKSGIKLKFNKNQKLIKSQTQYCLKQAATLEVQDHIEQYFKQQHEALQQMELKQKRKAKLKIISDRKHRKYFTEFDINLQNKKAPPSIKDVQLFKYIHGQMLIEKFQQKQEDQKEYFGNIMRSRKSYHILSNFDKPSELYAFDDCDQSFESMKEMKLSNLYAQSIELQQKLLTERRIVNQVQQSKQIDQTTNLIQIVNKQKLK